MNIFADFQSRITVLLEKRIAGGELPRSLDLGRFVVGPPRESAHGDLSTNAAMVYAREAKEAGSNPRALAARLALDLPRQPDVLRAETAGPGAPKPRPRSPARTGPSERRSRGAGLHQHRAQARGLPSGSKRDPLPRRAL